LETLFDFPVPRVVPVAVFALRSLLLETDLETPVFPVVPVPVPPLLLPMLALPELLAPFVPPSPQTRLDTGARIQVVLGRTGTATADAPVSDVVAVEAREEDGRIVARRVLHAK